MYAEGEGVRVSLREKEGGVKSNVLGKGKGRQLLGSHELGVKKGERGGGVRESRRVWGRWEGGSISKIWGKKASRCYHTQKKKKKTGKKEGTLLSERGRKNSGKGAKG